MTASHTLAGFAMLASLIWPVANAAAQSPEGALVAFKVEVDAINAPLGGKRGEAARGKAIMLDVERGNCGICHRYPGGRSRSQGDIGPDLAGVGQRLSEGQLRLRVVDGTRINPETIMPPYYRVEGLRRVRAKFSGRPILTAREVEHVVAFLNTMKE